MVAGDNEANERTSRFRLDNLGRKFGRIAATSIVLFVFSAIGFVLYAQTLSENSTVEIYSPPVIAMAGSWTGLWISLFGYSIWSVRQLQRLSADQEKYLVQRKRALVTFGLGILVLLMPFAIIYGSPRGS
jgi:hypothetical protein